MNALRAQDVEARFQDSSHPSTTEQLVAAGLGLTLSARPWLEGAEGIVWRPLEGVRIAIRTAAAWRTANRWPLLRTLVGLLPAAPEDGEAATPPRRRPRSAGPRSSR